MATFLFNLQDGITHIRGTLRRNADGTRLEARTDSHGRTRLYLMPKYKRSTPVSDAEIAGRKRFACIARMIRQRRMAGDKRPHKLRLALTLDNAIRTSVGIRGLNTLIYGWLNLRHYGPKYRNAIYNRDWLYVSEVQDLSDYAGYDLLTGQRLPDK